jgi:hypothetical protein
MQLSNTNSDETAPKLSLGEKENEFIWNNTDGNGYESDESEVAEQLYN